VTHAQGRDGHAEEAVMVDEAMQAVARLLRT
jgi:hypothetical protein